MAIFNPLLISIICVIGVLLIFHIDYDDYNEGGKYISYLLTPATVCLAVPLYEQIHLLKKNLKAVAAGIFSGTLAGLCSILLMAKLFGFDHQEYVTMLPKSITTAIGMGVSEELGGIVTITVAVIIITGVLGNMIAEVVYKIAKIEEPIARGLGLDSAKTIGIICPEIADDYMARSVSYLEKHLHHYWIWMHFRMQRDFIRRERKLYKADAV